MKKTITLLRKIVTCAALLAIVPASAQVATTYTFAQAAGTYTTVSGGTLLANAASGDMDDAVFGPLTIPAFTFDGNTYTSIYVSSNGFITFGSAPQYDEYDPLSGTDTYQGAVSAWGQDLDAAGSGTRNIRFQVVGSEAIIQWTNTSRYGVSGERISFQIRLNTSNNQIKIVYGGTITPGSDTDYLQVGLRGPDNTFATNINNRKSNAGTGAWINSTAGTNNSSTMYFNSATTAAVPATGTTFTWTPSPVDVKALTLVAPGAGGCYSNNEAVSFSISNVGGAALNFATTPVTLNVTSTGLNPMSFAPVVINTGTLAVNATQTVSVATGYDMSMHGTYTFNATVSATGDAHAGNNTATATRISHTPYVAYTTATTCMGTGVALMGTDSAYNYSSSTTNATSTAIPDDTPAGVNSTITVSGAGSLPASAITVTINNLTHTFDGDLIFTLTAPNGSSIVLSNQEGSLGENYIGTQFSDAATTPIAAGSAPFTGTFNPETPFSSLTGLANGTWTLNVSDNAAADVGTLYSWTIAYTVSNSIASYHWAPASTLSSDTVMSPIATPLAATTYTVTVTDISGCTNSTTALVNVNSLPTVIATADFTTVCQNGPVTLNGAGANTYTWDNGVTNNTPFPASATTTYHVTGTDMNGCTNTDSILVTVNPLPAVTATASAAAVCAGGTETLTGGGASSYTWDNGVSDGIAFMPSATATYHVSGTDINGCTNTDSITVTVNALPAVVATASAPTICEGGMETLNGDGASTYAWDNGVSDGVAFNATTTATYHVTGTDANGCMNMDSVTVTVNALPAVTATASAATLCEGSSETLTGGGASSYTWDNGVSDGVAFNATATTTYHVTGTDINGCMNMDSVMVTVNALPNVTANASATTLCEGGSETLTGSGATSYTWDNGVSDGVAFNATTTTTYNVTGTDANGCSNTASVTVNVNPLPNVDVTFANTTYCVYTTAFTLSGESPAGGTWSGNGVSGDTFDPSAAGAGTSVITYSYTDANGCTAMDTASLVVDLCTGIASSVNETGFNAYPNPTSGEITLQLSGITSNEVILEMTDMLGKRVYSDVINAGGSELTTRLDISSFAKGTYLLKVNTGTSVKMLKIMKQ